MTIGMIGIDCTTQAKKTGLVFGFFENGEVRLEIVTTGSNSSAQVNQIVEWTHRKDEFLEDTENLPDPAALAQEIVENLETTLMQFESIVEELGEDV